MTLRRGSFKLRDKTIALIKERRRQETYQVIAEQTNLPQRWVEQFAQGLIIDPSVNRVEALYEYLTGREFQV